MFCTTCGKAMPEDTGFCTKCGQPVQQSADIPPPPVHDNRDEAAIFPLPVPPAPVHDNREQAAVCPMPVPPSLASLTCPFCHASNWTVLGMTQDTAKDMVADQISCQCNNCKNKFTVHPLAATPDEMLSAPCEIRFTRVFSTDGENLAQIIYLNGVEIGLVKNGETLSFATTVRNNIVYVTGLNGQAFKGEYKFEAQPGGQVDVRFNGHFL